MTEVVLTTSKWAHTATKSRDHHHRGVEYRDSEHHQRCKQLWNFGYRGAHLETEIGHHEPDEEASCITHIDGCRVKVAAQKPQHRTCQPNGEECAVFLIVEQRDQKEGC